MGYGVALPRLSALPPTDRCPDVSRTPSRRRARALTTTAAALSLSLLTQMTPARAETAPLGSPVGWQQVLRESFTGALNTANWGPYDGQPGGNPDAWWSPTHIEMHGGQAWLRGYRDGGGYTTAGMMLFTRPQTYGKYLVRMRFDRVPGIEQVMLLWPVSGWPPEVDITEGESNGRTMMTSHWSSTNQQKHLWADVDMRLWHTYGLEWTPTALRFTIDGRVVGTMTGAAVPRQPMNLAIQTHATRAVPTSTPPATLAVDWVSVYRRR